MSLIQEGELNVRIIEAEGDKDSATFCATVLHVTRKTGSDCTFDYIIKGPDYSCRMHYDHDKWVVIAHEDHAPAAPEKAKGKKEKEILYNEPGK